MQGGIPAVIDRQRVVAAVITGHGSSIAVCVGPVEADVFRIVGATQAGGLEAGQFIAVAVQQRIGRGRACVASGQVDRCVVQAEIIESGVGGSRAGQNGLDRAHGVDGADDGRARGHAVIDVQRDEGRIGAGIPGNACASPRHRAVVDQLHRGQVVEGRAVKDGGQGDVVVGAGRCIVICGATAGATGGGPDQAVRRADGAGG